MTTATETTNRFLNFENDDARKILMRWWNRLHTEKKAERSDLCRYKSLDEIIVDSRPYWNLTKALRRQNYQVNPLNLAIVAGLLAKLREHTDETFPYLAAHPKDSKKSDHAAMKLIRFKRLVGYQNDPQEFFNYLRQCLGLTGYKANVPDLANAAYWWMFENAGRQIRGQWAETYYTNYKE